MTAGSTRWRPPEGWRPAWAIVDRRRIAALSKRSQQVLLLAGTTGAVVGLLVAGFDKVTVTLLGWILGLPTPVRVVAPGVGLLVAAGCLRLGGRNTTPSTSDEYIRAFHARSGHVDLRAVPARILAAVATLGSGGPLGYEGPALYAGAAVGSTLQRRLKRYFSTDESNLLMVAGAAAGVSAIFKAPVTGLIFALEVPYQEDLARRMLLPAAISAAASYVVFAAIAGTEPILPIAGQPPFNLIDLGGAAAVGLAAGLLARLFVGLIREAKRLSVQGTVWGRAAAGGAVIGATVLLGTLLGGSDLVLGPGYRALRWALEPDRGILGIVALGTLRVAGTAAVVGAGGTGGLFVPLVIQGALVGRVIGGIFDSGNATLFPVVGIAAFLGAGYRVPLAAVVFVAEFTGRPGFVVPGLIAAVVAQLVMGRASVSEYQLAGRVGHLEGRLQLPVSAVVSTELGTVPPDASVQEFFWQHLVGTRQYAVPVVDGDTYLGLAGADELDRMDHERWEEIAVKDVMRTDVPVATPAWTLGAAIAAMEEAGTDRLAVCHEGRFVGVIKLSDLGQLDEILDRTPPQ